jgi:hypothetical protein
MPRPFRVLCEKGGIPLTYPGWDLSSEEVPRISRTANYTPRTPSNVRQKPGHQPGQVFNKPVMDEIKNSVANNGSNREPKASLEAKYSK